MELRFLKERLEEHSAKGLTRRLTVADPNRIDLYSNDYLGIAKSGEAAILMAKRFEYHLPFGSTGSRLLSGNSNLHLEFEEFGAHFHRGEGAILFNSGFDANLALLSALPHRGDTVIYDSCIHASARDGIRLSAARAFNFRHNDLDDLADKLDRSSGERFVVVDSLYSMEGDLADLRALLELTESKGAHLIVDEAHTTGCYGERGAGLCVELGIENRIFARLHTFGKAIGCHGAFVCGPKPVVEYLRQTARPFFYSTAISPHAVGAALCSYELVAASDEHRQRLFRLIDRFIALAQSKFGPRVSAARAPIQSILYPGVEAARFAQHRAGEVGFEVRAIVSPTVAAGSERLRVCIHSFNTEDEIERFIEELPL